MRYVLAIVFPPLAVLSCGKLFGTLISIPLTCLFWIPGIIHACAVVAGYNADRRTSRVVNAISGKPQHQSFRLS
jgi:uncharacterized membrane protein YqaE (UPF0057 family)